MSFRYKHVILRGTTYFDVIEKSAVRFVREPSARSAKGAFYTAIFFVFIMDAALVAQFFIR
jgi:hypothetical protein